MFYIVCCAEIGIGLRIVGNPTSFELAGEKRNETPLLFVMDVSLNGMKKLCIIDEIKPFSVLADILSLALSSGKPLILRIMEVLADSGICNMEATIPMEIFLLPIGFFNSIQAADIIIPKELIIWITRKTD